MNDDRTWTVELNPSDSETIREIESLSGEAIRLAPLSWGSQDLNDWSGKAAIFVTLSIGIPGPVSSLPTEVRWRISEEMGPHLEHSVEGAVREQGLEASVADPEAQYYQVGPAAEGIPHYVVTLWEHRDAIGMGLSQLADAYAVTVLARKTVSKMKEWVHSDDAPQLDVVVYFPVHILTLLCEEHVRKQYHPRAKFSTSWYPPDQGFFDGISTPAHPIDMLSYLILVKTADREYAFRIGSDASVVALMLRQGKVVSKLPIPDLLAERD